MTFSIVSFPNEFALLPQAGPRTGDLSQSPLSWAGETVDAAGSEASMFERRRPIFDPDIVAQILSEATSSVYCAENT